MTVPSRAFADNPWLKGQRLVPGRPRPMERGRLGRLTLFAFLFTTFYVGWLALRYVAAPDAFARLPADWLASLGLLSAASLLTLLLFWTLLFWQWHRQPAAARLPQLTVEQLTVISPRAFEHFVGEVFERRGYQVAHRGRSGDLGVDLEIVNAAGRRAIVQCKRYRNTIGPEIVRELFGTMLHELADHGFLVATSDFSDAAREWARGKPITLIDGDTLVALVRELADV
jgi:restriction system protein